MPSSSFGGDSHTKGEPGSTLQPKPVDRPKWAGEPWDEKREVGEFEYEDGRPAYVKGQIIVTGREADVKAVVSEVLGISKTLQDPLQDPIDLEGILPADASERFPDPDQGHVVIDLYDTGDLSVRDAVEAIQAARGGKAIFADPNYVTGHPHIPVGSPHIPVGSGLDGVAEAEGEFWEQWAFGGQEGIGLTAGGQRSNSLNYTGEGIRVAVFDTSPFPNPRFWEIDWISPKLELCVSHLLGPAHTTTKTADHGLFVAGLVHAVAPHSEIELIQVLNEEAVGDLYTINYALAKFMLQRLVNNAGTLNNTVMNLSLGFPKPSAQAGFDPDVVCFATLLHGAASLGATVVAAAGNASSSSGPLPAEVPAAYASVIGVAASNKNQGRSCFSNEGDVAAPGGDTYEPRTHQCVDHLILDEKGKVKDAMIGVAPHSAPKSGYAYWVGTSFSAPLVSGLAALVLERRGPQPLANILADVTGGAGPAVPVPGLHIINVPGSLGLP